MNLKFYTNKYTGGLYHFDGIEANKVKLKNAYGAFWGNKIVTKKAFRRHWEISHLILS